MKMAKNYLTGSTYLVTKFYVAPKLGDHLFLDLAMIVCIENIKD